MENEKQGKNTKILRIRIDPELLEQVKDEANRLNIGISAYVRWCISTGLYLKDLNTFFHSTRKEEELIKFPKR